MKLTPPNKIKRSADLFVKIQNINKHWLKKEVKLQGFNSLAEYLDTLFTALRKKKDA